MKTSKAPGGEDSGVLARVIKRLRDALEEGGPEVSHPLLAAYIDGELDANERETVRQLIDQYRNWNDAYWDVWCAIKDADEASDLDESSAQIPGARKETESNADVTRGATKSGLEGDGISRKLSRSRQWKWYSLFAMAASVLVAVGVFVWDNWNKREPQYIAQLNDAGGVVALDKDGNLSGLESVPQEWREKARGVLLAQHVAVPKELVDLTATRGSSIDDPSSLLLSPVGTVIETDRPTFRWKRIPRAETYTVSVFDSTLKKKVAPPSGPLVETEWTVLEPLNRGKVFAWKLTVMIDGQERFLPLSPALPPRFKILDKETAEAIERARSEYDNSHLLLGILCAEAGLTDEAEREFRLLAGANPNSPVATKLLESLRSITKSQP